MDFGIGGRFTCKTDAGALLYLWDRGGRTVCDTNTTWQKHIARNFESWETFFATRGLENKEMIIVRGFVKSSAWDAFAWCQSSASRDVRVSIGAPGHGAAGIVHSASIVSTSAPERRSFPPRGNTLESPLTKPQFPTSVSYDLEVSDDSQSGDPIRYHHPELQFEQTVFLSYYRAKRRLFVKKVSANAGYYNLPPRSPDSDIGGGAEILTEMQRAVEVRDFG